MTKSFAVFRVRVLAAGAADHDLVLLDRDLDGAVPGPVLGVDGVVLDGGIEPQPVALLAVVERRLERRGLASAAAATAPPALAPAPAGRLLLGLRIVLGLGGALRLGLCGLSLGCVELGSDQRIVLG